MLYAGEVDAVDAGFGAMLDEIFLKVHVPVAGFDDGGNGLIGHRQDTGFDAESVTDRIGSLGESFALGEQIGAVNVGGEIAIAEIEPGFTAVDAESFEEMKGFAAYAPAGRGIHDPGERVGDDIEVGRNFQAVEDDVVAGVDDDSEGVGIHCMIETEEKFRRADTTCEGGDREFLCGGHGGDKDAGREEIQASGKPGRGAEG